VEAPFTLATFGGQALLLLDYSSMQGFKGKSNLIFVIVISIFLPPIILLFPFGNLSHLAGKLRKLRHENFSVAALTQRNSPGK